MTGNSDQSPPGSHPKRRFDLVDLIGSRIPMVSRKKSKNQDQSQDDSKDQSTTASSTTTLTPSETTAESDSTLQPSSQTKDNPAPPIPSKDVKSKGSPSEVRGSGWYGSWRQKARPVTAVRKESIGASASPAPSISKPVLPSRKESESVASPSPRRYMSGSLKAASAKSLPLVATTTNLSISSNGTQPDPKARSEVNIQSAPQEATQDIPEAPLPPDPSISIPTTKPQDVDGISEASRPKSSAGWFGGWWSRPDDYEGNQVEEQQQKITDDAKNTPLPGATPSEEISAPPMVDATKTLDEPVAKEIENGQAVDKPSESSKSWFWLWSSSQNEQTIKPADEQKSEETQNNPPPVIESNEQAEAQSEPQPEAKPGSRESSIKDGKAGSKRAASGWAFWSRQTEEPSGWAAAQNSNKQVGELAVANTPSQSNPEAAQFNEIEGSPKKNAKKPNVKKTRGKQPKQNQAAGTVEASTTTIVADKAVAVAQTPADVSLAQTVKGMKKGDLLLPEFKNTYSLVQQPSVWQNIRHYFLGGEQHHPHLHIVNNTPRVKKALAIGIHGFFPAAILQKVIGAPTGTSIRFSNMAASAIQQWTEARGYECEIEKIALEGEGLIADRVETLWKLLLNWIEHIRTADFILLACHSQGVPVTIMLVERLIRFGCVSGAKIGICAMAGINLGPFAEYRTQLFGRSGLELFDFSRPDSKVSKAYLSALKETLSYGVKIVYIGAIDDQLVSLESSTFSNVSHPCIYRAVFLDGRHFASDFLTNLVAFALKLRNLGLSDHGLIRELSPALAGSLYGGEGHSRLYDCIDLYSLAVSHTLETTFPVPGTQLIVKSYEGPPGSKDANPFFLPWAMRGVLEEEKVRRELGDECRRLLDLFEEWKPTSKGLKDVRFRLEALKSKL